MVAFFFPPVGQRPQITLTQKGYGRVGFSDNGTRTLNYSTVGGGSAPSAGDMVAWVGMRFATDGAPQPFNDLTGSGWAQQRITQSSNTRIGTILAKVVTAGDISSPPTILSENPVIGDGLLMWVAYTVTGGAPTLTSTVTNLTYGDTSAPSSINVNSSTIDPTDYAITFGEKSGSAGATLGGVTWNETQTYSGSGAPVDLAAGARLDLGGANYTVTGADNGTWNMLLAGYVRVQS